MAGLCWVCHPNHETNDFAGWLNQVAIDEAWGWCDGCGKHLIDNTGMKVCSLPADATGWGDPTLGCGHCHAWRREQHRLEDEGEDQPVRNSRHWSEWEEGVIVRMSRQGKTSRDIGAAVRRSPRAIVERLTKLGAQKFRDRRLAAYRGSTSRWTPAEVSTMLQLIDQGYSNPQISALLGRTPAAINRKLYKIGKSDARGAEACLECSAPLKHDGRKGRKRKFCCDSHSAAWHNRKRRAR